MECIENRSRGGDRAAGPEAVQGHPAGGDLRFIPEAHAAGLRVDVWTIDEPDEMRELLDLEVDGVMTGRPDRLTDVLASPT